jgi:hypothetical protein
MRFRLVGLLFLVFISISSKAETNVVSAFVFYEAGDSLNITDSKKIIIQKKIKAASLALLLGPFGMHRLYLGTDPKIPVVYSLTYGAFGIIPLIDIIAILSTKDLSQFEDNNQIIMWIR